MKKILIILGVLILLIGGAVWTYVFLYGVPQSADEVFGRFTEAPDRPGYTNTNDDGIVDIGNDDEDTGEVARTRLYQLTTRPVAGATFVSNGIRYVERGTGHIYEIALTGGGERMVSGTTRPRTIRAVFSPDGERVALTSESDAGLVTVLGTIVRIGSDANLEITALPQGAEEAGFTPDGKEFNFFVPTEEGGSGYAYSLETKKTTLLFTVPLSDVRVLWGNPTYVYTTPSAKAMGYVYRVGASGAAMYVTEGAKGLMAMPFASSTLVSKITPGGIATYYSTGELVPLLRMIPEKCAPLGTSAHALYCGNPVNFDSNAELPDDWYKGVAGTSDEILLVNSTSTPVTVLSSLEQESGRPIDVLSLGVNADGNMIHFTNKYDGALWMLDLR